MKNTFSQWILDQLDDRDWSQAELARRAGISRTAISDVISGNANAGYNLCSLHAAKALELPLKAFSVRPDYCPQIQILMKKLNKFFMTLKSSQSQIKKKFWPLFV